MPEFTLPFTTRAQGRQEHWTDSTSPSPAAPQTQHTHFQTMAFSLALYFAFPFIQMTCTPLVLRGVGIRTWKAESGEQEQGDCSLGTLHSLRGRQPPRRAQLLS